MAVGAEDADEVVNWPGPETVINTEDEAEGAARVISGSILPKREGGRSSRPRRGEGGRLNIGWNPDIGDATGGQALSSSPPLTTSPSLRCSWSSGRVCKKLSSETQYMLARCPYLQLWDDHISGELCR